MTTFTTKLIPSHTRAFCILNVGSYKVKCVICDIGNQGIQLLGYGEKRQSRLDICNGEISNITGVTNTISQAINIAEIDAGTKSDLLICNAFFCESFLSAKTLNYKQANNHETIELKHVKNIISYIEQHSLNHTLKEIESYHGIPKSDLEIIFSTISNIKLDGADIENLIGKSGEDIYISLLNIFISKENHQIISDICGFLGKKLYKVIPEEYSLTQIAPESVQNVSINIGNTVTLITIIGDKGIIGATKIGIGINDLLKDINKTQQKHRSEIIKKLNREDLFKEEKKKFLEFFIQLLSAGIKEIIQLGICPHNFIISGGGANNNCIKDYIEKTDFNLFGIKILKHVSCIDPSIHKIREISGIESILSLENISIIAQMLTAKRIIETKHNILSQALKESIDDFLSK